jgi:3-hydroxybutyryl-CoA dehydrogenase
MATIERVAVVGVGAIGSGVAEVCARSGMTVAGIEADAGAAGAARDRIEQSIGRAVERGKLDKAAAAKARERIHVTTDHAAAANADILVEALPEDRELKIGTLQLLGRTVAPAAIFATTTSSLFVTELAAASGRPERFLGFHFFNPVPVMGLVEVVRGFRTSPETYEAALAFVSRIGKAPITVRDRPGFVVHRLLMALLIEAVQLLESGYATRDDIDKGMMLGCGHPMGPLKLLDYVGLDYAIGVAQTLLEEYQDERFRPPPLLRQMVAAGLLGRKTGRGFYEWPKGS